MLNKAVNGGGLYQLYPDNHQSVLETDTFSGNYAATCGGAFFNDQNYPGDSIANCLFSGNKAGARGGAIYDSLAGTYLYNCTLAGDTAGLGNGIYVVYNSGATVRNSIVWDGNTGIFNAPFNGPLLVSYSTVQGGYTGTGILSGDPLFVAPLPASLAPTAAGNYDIIRCSPAIDAGTNSGRYAGPTDLAGRPRLYGGTVDQGAYEYGGAPYPAAITGNATVCTGRSMQLGNVNPGGSWTSSNPSVATVSQAGLVSSIAPGTDTITYSATQGTCTGTAIKIITVVVGPATGVTQAGARLTAAETGAAYQWINCTAGNVPVGAAQGQIFTAIANGQYAVIVSKNGCTDTSACYSVTGLSVSGVSGPEGISIYPNPAAGELTVTANGMVPGHMLIRDMAGRVVQEEKPKAPLTTIRVDRLVAGVYLLEVYNGTRCYRERVMVLH